MPKCKVCGSRVPDGISECPMCGAKISNSQNTGVQETKSTPVKPTPVQTQESVPVAPSQKPSVASSAPRHTQAKCKVCGSRIPEGASACPMCGAKVKAPASTETSVQKPIPVQSQENQNPHPEYHPSTQTQPKKPSVHQKPQPQIDYDDDDEDEETTYRPVPNNKPAPTEKKNGGCLGKIISGIFSILFVIVALYFIFGNDSSSNGNTSQKSVQTPSYAKIEHEFIDVIEDDFTYRLAINSEFFGLLVDPNQFNSNDKKAINDAINYLKQHEQLQNYGLYKVTLYKHYYSEKDSDGWFVFLRYIRRDETFNVSLIRF